MPAKDKYGSLETARGGASTGREGHPLLQQASTLSSGGGGGFGSEDRTAVGASAATGTTAGKEYPKHMRLSLKGGSNFEQSGRFATVHNDPDVKNVQTSGILRGSTRMLELYLKQVEKQGSERHGTRHRRQMSDPGILPVGIDRNAAGSNLIGRDILAAIGSSTRSIGRIMFEHIDPSHTWYDLAPGSIQQSVVVATVIAVVNGLACFLYYTLLELSLKFFWHTLPEWVGAFSWDESNQWIWIPCVAAFCCVGCGISVILLGEPGDMPFTISCVHGKAFIPMDHVLPMVVASFCSILAGGSLGPEAPLVAICGALGGFVSRRIFGQRHRNVVRKHTLMGMAGALSAFFGAPLGGSLFSLEINSRFGVEYFEHMSESIFCGELTLVVFRAASRLSIAPIWEIGDILPESPPYNVIVGLFLGFLGAGLAYIFALFHTYVMAGFGRLGLLDNSMAVYRALLGGVGFVVIGVMIPQTLFWSEQEIPVQANGLPSSELPHVWPTSGMLGFESASASRNLLVGLAKLAAISFTMAGGLRGGLIFPLMLAGVCVGRAISLWSGLPLPLATLCLAAGTNVAITRAALGTSLVLVFLSGHLVTFPAILMASLTSLFATGYLKFLKTQICRSDVDHSLFRQNPRNQYIDDDEAEISSDDE